MNWRRAFAVAATVMGLQFAGVQAKADGAIVVNSCNGAIIFPTGVTPQPLVMDRFGNLCGSGTGGTAQLSNSITNPTSVLTRPSDTNAYAQNDFLGSSVTAGSVVVPSFAIANSAGGASIPRVRLSTNKASGWDTVVLRVRLWTAAPTYTNGDNGAYAVATGGAGLIGVYDVTLSQFGDAASGQGSVGVGTAAFLKLAAGTSVFWDIQYTGSASLTPASGQTFTITPELVN